MEQGLLLDRLQVARDDPVVDQRVELAADVVAHGAHTATAVGDPTVVGAQCAQHLLVRQRLVVAGFVQGVHALHFADVLVISGRRCTARAER